MPNSLKIKQSLRNISIKISNLYIIRKPQNKREKERMKDDIERIFSQIGGTFGKFQTRCNILLGLTILLTTMYGLDYVFVALGLEYR